MDALPDDVIAQSEWLLLFQGWTSFMAGDIDAADACLARISADAQSLADVLRCQIAFARKQLDRAEHYARLVLDSLPDSPWRVMALWILAEVQENAGEIAAMIDSLQQITVLARDDQIFGPVVTNFLAVALNNCGQRQQALTVVQRALEQNTSPVTTLLQTTAGRLYYDANQLEQSAQHFDRSLALAQQLGMNTLLLVSYGMRAPLDYARGEPRAAFETLQRAIQLATGEVLGETAWVYAQGVTLHLRNGDYLAAQQLAGHLPTDLPPSYDLMDAQISHARWLIAKNQLAEARQWLGTLEDYLAPRGLNRWLLSIMLLQALIADHLTDRARCTDYLTQAVQIAAPEQIIRAFLDEDPHLLTLLPAVRATAPGFVDQVLAAAGLSLPAEHADTSGSLLEPLSPREVEVLTLIAQGHSNAEVADKLVLATSTVKRHINHIYGKLGITRRTQAILKAQQIGLI
jgi:LuxR family maltose regulon positive regulatory protein